MINSEIVVLVTVPGPGIVKALKSVKERNIRVIGVAPSRVTAGFFFVDKSYIVPEGKNYIKKILKICQKEHVDILIPIASWHIIKFAENKKLFKKINVKVAISSLQSLKLATDKALLFKRCNKIGIPVPRFYLVHNSRQFKKAVFSLGYPRNNVCFKPQNSAGSRGFRILSNKVDYGDLLLNQEGGSIYTTFKNAADILKTKKPYPKLLVMEFLAKEEFSVDGLADKGVPLIIVPRLRQKIISGGSVIGEAIYHREIINYCKKIVKMLKLDGVFGMQFRLDNKGNIKLLEVNPRFHGALIFTIAVGAHLPYLAIKLLLGEKIKIPKIKWKTKMMRYFAEVYLEPEGKYYVL